MAHGFQRDRKAGTRSLSQKTRRPSPSRLERETLKEIRRWQAGVGNPPGQRVEEIEMTGGGKQRLPSGQRCSSGGHQAWFGVEGGTSEGWEIMCTSIVAPGRKGCRKEQAFRRQTWTTMAAAFLPFFSFFNKKASLIFTRRKRD